MKPMKCHFAVLAAFCLLPAAARGSLLLGELEQVAPIPASYLESVDFATFSFGATGEAYGLLQSVPGQGETGDFAGFVAGNIALIERGTIPFRDKVFNAEGAGAKGVLIYNDEFGSQVAGDVPVNGSLGGPGTSIPALSLRRNLGLDLLQQLQSDDVTIRMRVSNVPEPSSLAIWLLLGGMAAIRARRVALPLPVY